MKIIENEVRYDINTEMKHDTELITKASSMKNGCYQIINNTVCYYQTPFTKIWQLDIPDSSLHLHHICLSSSQPACSVLASCGNGAALDWEQIYHRLQKLNIEIVS